ncbi:unnamed protein product [Oreochromis niloticus]|nr:unnamed protein product [Mustela putorius furo]
MLSPELQVWIREHNPGSAMEAVRLADVFVAARKKGQAWSHNAWKASRDTRKIPQQNHLDSANTSTSKTPQSITRPPKASEGQRKGTWSGTGSQHCRWLVVIKHKKYCTDLNILSVF